MGMGYRGIVVGHYGKINISHSFSCISSNRGFIFSLSFSIFKFILPFFENVVKIDLQPSKWTWLVGDECGSRGASRLTRSEVGRPNDRN
jgi:hypothetical protein